MKLEPLLPLDDEEAIRREAAHLIALLNPAKTTICLPDNSKPKVEPNKARRTFMKYRKQSVLRALLMYHKKWDEQYSKIRNLHEAKRLYGTQFLLDLYIFTEIYANHYPTVRIEKCREDVTKVLNVMPNWSVKYEAGEVGV